MEQIFLKKIFLVIFTKFTTILWLISESVSISILRLVFNAMLLDFFSYNYLSQKSVSFQPVLIYQHPYYPQLAVNLGQNQLKSESIRQRSRNLHNYFRIRHFFSKESINYHLICHRNCQISYHYLLFSF